MSENETSTQKQTTQSDELSGHLYCMKLQCLSVVLGKESCIDKQTAERTAEAINAAFDKITY